MKNLILILSITISSINCLSQTTINDISIKADTLQIDSVEFYRFLVNKFYPTNMESLFNGPYIYLDENNKEAVIKSFTNDKGEIRYQQFVPDQFIDGSNGPMTKLMIEKYLIIYKRSLLNE